MIGGLRPCAAALALAVAAAFAGCGGSGEPPSQAMAANVDALPSLIKSLKGRDPAARTRAAVSIGRMGPAAVEAVSALTTALKDRDVAVRASAAHALGKIGPEARAALPDLQNLTKQAALREVADAAIREIEN